MGGQVSKLTSLYTNLYIRNICICVHSNAGMDGGTDGRTCTVLPCCPFTKIVDVNISI